MAIKAVRLKDHGTVHPDRTDNPGTMVAPACTRGLLAILLLAVTISGLPKPVQEKKAASNLVEDVTLSTELEPPPLTDDEFPPGYLLIVNLYAVKNVSGENFEDMLENEVVESLAEAKVPIGSLLLLLDEDEGNETAVSLKEFADDMTREGYHVQTFEKDGEIKVIIVDLQLMDVDTALNRTTLNNPERLTKVRHRRSPCMRCMMGGGGGGGGKKGGGGGSMGGGCGGSQCGMMMMPSGCGGNPCGMMMHPSGGGCGGGGGGCGGGGGGGGGGMKTVTIPVYVVPVQVSMGGGGGGHRPMGGGGGCNPCQGYGGHPSGGHQGGGYQGGGGSGGGGSYSQSQAQASASSSSYGWGKK